MTIAIYSDFDGVFNISDSSATASATIETTDSHFLRNKDSINWSPEIVKSMNELLATGLYDFIWHTTWNDGGNILKAAEIMGFEGAMKHTDAVLNQNAGSKMEWTRWKAEYIIADQAENPRPFIWIDDLAPYFWGDHIRGSFRHLPLIIHTNGRVGLTNKDIVKIIDWTQKQLNQGLVAV